MSKAALALLDGDDTESAPEKTPAKRAIDMLEGKETPEAQPSAAPPKPHGTAALGVLETGAHYVSGALSLPVQAAASLYKLATATPGLKAREASRASAAVGEALTYQPRTQEGEQMTNAADKVLGVPAQLGDAAAMKIADVTGSEGLAAGADVGIQALPALLGVRGVRSLPGAAARGAKAVGERIEAAPRGWQSTSPSSAQSDPLTGFGPDSASAAAASSVSAAKNISPELLTDLRQQVTKGPLAPEAVDRQIDADALPIRMRLMEGQASQDPEVWSHEFNAKGKDPAVAARFNEQNQQLIDNLDEFRQQVAPQAVAHDPVQSGQNIVDAYKRYDEAATADIQSKYKALNDANGGEFPVDGPSFVAQADQALKKKFKGRYVPPQIAADMEAIRSGEVAMNFEQFENLRTNLAAEARKAERSGDGNAAGAVNIVREALESLPMTGEAANLKPLADAARQAAKARFDRLRADPAYRASVDDDAGIGEASPLADQFVQKYIVGGSRAHIGRMMESLGQDELAMETIRAAPFNYMKKRAGIDPYRNQGDFSQAGYNKALAELTPKLDLIVGQDMAEQAQRLGRVAYNVKAAPAGSFPNRSNTFIAATAEAAKGLAERSANTFIGGNVVPVGSWAREKLDARVAARESRERMRPAAGTLARAKRDKP